MYARVNRYYLWDSPRYKEVFEFGDLHFEIIPNDYYDGSDPPDVIVKYNGEMVLHAVAKQLGGGVGGYRIKVFREGDWLNTVDQLYKKADESFVRHHRSEKEKIKKNFSPIE